MKIAVRYYSKTGNTEKLANAISKALGVKALPITQPVNPDTEVLFLGSSVYGAGVANEVKAFILSLDKNIGSVVNFSSAAISESTYKQVKKLVEAKGINMSEKEYHCRGRFTILHRGRPNEKDLKEAASFAKDFIDG